jgi:hypothetical protein
VAWKIGNKKMNDNFYSLYKYRPLFTLDLEGQRHPHPFTANIFKDAQIYYAAPKSFNDPFDCNLKLHFDDATQEEWRIYFDSLAKTYPRIQSNLQKAKRDIFRSKNGPEWRKFSNHLKVRIEKSRKWHYEDSSVFCLSKKPNSTQMFSYYADSHQGIAIEFKFGTRTIPCGIPFGDPTNPKDWYAGKIAISEVAYQEELPELNFIRLSQHQNQIVHSLMFTKQKDWSHEQEVRIFRLGVKAAAAPFERSMVSHIIFGCKANEAEVLLVKDWLRDWPVDVTLSKAEQVQGKFDLEIKYLETIKGKG